MIMPCVFSTAAMMAAAILPLVTASSDALAQSRALLAKVPQVMGEYGAFDVSIGEYTRVNTTHTYVNPVVVVGNVGMYTLLKTRPISAYVSEAGSDYFVLRTEDGQEGDIRPTEEVPYLVMEAGDYTFEDGTRITAGFTYTRAARAEPSPARDYTMVDLEGFNSEPSIVASFMNETDANVAAWSAVRVGDRGDKKGAIQVTPTEFGIRGQTAEFASTHERSESTLVGFVAMEPRSGMENLNVKRIEAGTQENMPSGTAVFTSTTFDSDFQEAPTFLAVAGDVGRDGINVRHRTFQNGQYEVAVQEPDSSSHAREDLYHYIAMDGTGHGNMLMGYTWPEASEPPSLAPTVNPSAAPSGVPTESPSFVPTMAPITVASTGPTTTPSSPPSDAPFCSAGIIDSSGGACCAASCGTCGGCGCAKRGDVLHQGASYCCPTAIRRAEVPCELSSDVGCLIPLPTSAPTSFSSRNPTVPGSADDASANTPEASKRDASGPASPSGPNNPVPTAAPNTMPPTFAPNTLPPTSAPSGTGPTTSADKASSKSASDSASNDSSGSSDNADAGGADNSESASDEDNEIDC